MVRLQTQEDWRLGKMFSIASNETASCPTIECDDEYDTGSEVMIMGQSNSGLFIGLKNRG